MNCFEIDFMVKKKDLKKILQAIINVHGTFKTAEIMDLIKAIGYKYSTRAAMTISIADIIVPENKNEILDEGQKTVDEIQKNYRRGLVTEEERYKAVVDTWTEVDKKLTDATRNAG
jgi:DNA-directed RNA polymerase subunit beta'